MSKADYRVNTVYYNNLDSENIPQKENHLKVFKRQ